MKKINKEKEQQSTFDRLMQDPKFNKRFCDVEECYSTLPAIRLTETGDYYFGDDLNDFKRYYSLDKLLELE